MDVDDPDARKAAASEATPIVELNGGNANRGLERVGKVIKRMGVEENA
jgi:hypothetical protein